MQYLGVLSDYDGTVSSLHNTISDKVSHALYLLRDKGVKFGFCTGRAYAFIRPYVHAQGLNGVHVVCGGAQLVDDEGKILRETLIPAEVMHDIVHDVDNMHGTIVLKKGDDLYGNTLSIEDEKLRRGLHVRPLLELPDWNVPAFYVGQLDDEGWRTLETRTDINLIKQRGRHGRGGFFADGVAPGVDKGAGARWWCEYHHIDPNTVIGIGDGENDIDLFGAVGLGVAMGNAVPELKAVAQAIAPSIDEDGVAWMIHQYF